MFVTNIKLQARLRITLNMKIQPSNQYAKMKALFFSQILAIPTVSLSFLQKLCQKITKLQA